MNKITRKSLTEIMEELEDLKSRLEEALSYIETATE